MKRRNLVNPARTPVARDRCIYGTHAVLTWLQTHPEQLRRISYTARFPSRVAAILALATQAQVPHEPCSDETLNRMAGTPRHQGIVATAAPFAYAEIDRLIEATPRLLVLADQIQDPHNLGAILRTANAVGAGAVLIPRDSSVGVTATVEVAAAGAAAALPVCRVTNAARALQQLKAAGYWTVGLVAHGGTDLYTFAPPQRVVVVVGGETGMRPLVAKHCDFAVSIPMRGTVESLNASVATAVVLYEVVRRWAAEAPTIVSDGGAV
ncbi:MAG TPA: 23S rRNA (guanosine(2251)-2'-O)-methyltransferase RlmB [Candidatus Margulisiibacteriota bacterium]|nr:23S rRNA (guanosine(2251)-2'-O)-methyltransferase RlmB [Candidatus Margulisiibacteriota bacterium]